MADTSKALCEVGTDAIDKAFSFLEAILIPPCQEVGLLAQDQIKFWRFKNQVRILNKAQDILTKSNITPQKVSLKILVPLLECGSLEEDQTMQEKWASLLASASNPKGLNKSHIAYVEILKQLSPIEVKILDLLYGFDLLHIHCNAIDAAKLKEIGIREADYNILLSNLLRLGLVEELSIGKREWTNVPIYHTVNKDIALTDLGHWFIKACRAKG